MSPHNTTAVLIVGAGPTGLTLACELARRGIPLRLIDAASAPAVGSRAKGVQPRSLEVFDDLGVIDSVLDSGRFHLLRRLYDDQGGYLDQDAHAGHEPRPEVPYASTLFIPQWRIEQILRARLEALGGRVEYATALRGFTQEPQGITAELACADHEENLQASWLVGCDGGRSLTRRLLGVNFEGETIAAHRMLLGDVKASGLSRDYWHIWRNPAGLLALAPLPGTDVFQFQASIGLDDPDEPSLALFQQMLEARTGRHDIRLSEPTWMSVWRANVRMIDRYRVGRGLLAGDAAHVHSPAGGQGMNTGIQDAYNLGWKLAAVLGGADPALLDTYHEERLPIAAWLLGVSSKLHHQIFDGRQFPAQRNEEMLQLGLNYRACRLAQDLRPAPGGVRAGDRAPDAPGLRSAQHTCRLFDLLRGTHFTLLAFGNGWDKVIAQVQAQHGADLHCVVLGETDVEPDADAVLPRTADTAGHAARAYQIERDTLLLIRPDGYIGFASEERTAAPVLAYLAQCSVVRP